MSSFIFFYGLIFVLGVFFGSFLNVIIDRMPFNKSILFPASHCPHCRHKLGIFDLVPIFSFLYLKQRCRYCRTKISLYYPVTELMTGFLFVLTAYVVIGPVYEMFFAQLGKPGYIVYLFILISIFIVIFFIDLKYGIIPFRVVTAALGVITVRYLFLSSTDIGYILPYLLTAMCIFLLFFLLFFLSKGRAIGFGDVFFSLMMGYLLGYPRIVLGVYIAFLTGAFISLILVLLDKKRLKGGTIPFGPFLVLGTVISLFWGDPIIRMILLYLHGN